MCNNRECAEYLKKNPVYRRCMEELRDKWKRYGRIAGRITLPRATAEERRAIGGIIGKKLTDETVTFTFREFEQGLQKTRFAPVEMKAVLEEYFAGSLYTNQEQRTQARMEKEEFFRELSAYFEEDAGKTSAAALWAEELRRGKRYGYQILMKEFSKDPKEAEVLAHNVGRALLRLEAMDGEESLLAVFAAAVTGNPHYFDRGATAGQLLTQAVCFWKKSEAPQSAYEWRECMRAAGVVPDNIASLVHAFNVRLKTEDGPHPAYEAFCRRREPYVLTAENLRFITGAETKHDQVYVVENEMVFLYLVENTKDRDIGIVCTSGQLRAAALQLLDYLVKDGAAVCYSGDLDPAGMDIADRLWQRFGGAVRLWRMDAADYKRSISAEALSDRQMVRLERLKNKTLCRTAELVRKEKRAGYQENILPLLLEDIRDGVNLFP